MSNYPKRRARRAKQDGMTAGQYALLEELFMDVFPDRRNNPRMMKSETLYKLAKQAHSGAIVELGTWHGNGAISLAWGTRAGNGCPVHTVDPFVESYGWIGEPYHPEDLDIFRANIARTKVGIHLHQMTSQDAARAWIGPIALLFWDVGGKGPDETRAFLQSDFDAWGPHVIPGGLYAVHEPGDHQFGGRSLIERAQESGAWGEVVQYAGYVWTLRRKP